MTHGVRIYPDQFYQTPNVPAASWWETVDATLAAGVNGDGGGNWAPTSPIYIAGFVGMVCGGPWTLAGTATLNAPSYTPIVLGDNDYITLKAGHTGATRTLITPCGEFIDVSDLTSTILATNTGTATTLTLTTTSSPRILLPLRVHNGATIASIAFTFQIAVHANAPVSLPQFRAYQLDAFGVVTPLNGGTLGGYQVFTPTPISGPAWRAAGATQTFTYTPVGTFVVDTSRYAYFAEIVDESGLNAVSGNNYLAVAITFTGITDQRPQ